MAKFTFTIECQNLSEALCYVKALAEAGYSSRLDVDDVCSCCHGSGKVQKYTQPNVVAEVDCLVCRGTGKAPEY